MFYHDPSFFSFFLRYFYWSLWSGTPTFKYRHMLILKKYKAYVHFAHVRKCTLMGTCEVYGRRWRGRWQALFLVRYTKHSNQLLWETLPGKINLMLVYHVCGELLKAHWFQHHMEYIISPSTSVTEVSTSMNVVSDPWSMLFGKI